MLYVLYLQNKLLQKIARGVSFLLSRCDRHCGTLNSDMVSTGELFSYRCQTITFDRDRVRSGLKLSVAIGPSAQAAGWNNRGTEFRSGSGSIEIESGRVAPV